MDIEDGFGLSRVHSTSNGIPLANSVGFGPTNLMGLQPISTHGSIGNNTEHGPNSQWKRNYCNYRRKTGHTKDTCWELHEKPTDWKPRQNRLREYQILVENHKSLKNSSLKGAFNLEQLDHCKNLSQVSKILVNYLQMFPQLH